MDFLVDGSLGAGALVILAVALLFALSFEFVNGFHDTANAVATVIYTHSLTPNQAVIWSGSWNFLGVLFSSGAVAFGIVALLPVELILHVQSDAGFAMVFALLLSAIIWNLGTWYLGLPASSSHTLIGSIVGIGITNSLLDGGSFGEGVNWGKLEETALALLTSPLIGFVAAAAMDPLHPSADLHRRQLRAWVQRRTEGHRPHHAGAGRPGARGLCVASADIAGPAAENPRGIASCPAGLRQGLDHRPPR